MKTSNNECYNEWQRVTTNDNEWQWVTTSNNEWQGVKTNDNEWQRLTASSTTKENSTVHFKEWMISNFTMTKTDTSRDGRLQLEWLKNRLPLTLLLRRSLPCRNQSNDLHSKLMDWFLYDRDLRHEKIKGCVRYIFASLFKWEHLWKGQMFFISLRKLFSFLR